MTDNVDKVHLMKWKICFQHLRSIFHKIEEINVLNISLIPWFWLTSPNWWITPNTDFDYHLVSANTNFHIGYCALQELARSHCRESLPWSASGCLCHLSAALCYHHRFCQSQVRQTIWRSLFIEKDPIHNIAEILLCTPK